MLPNMWPYSGPVKAARLPSLLFAFSFASIILTLAALFPFVQHHCAPLHEFKINTFACAVAWISIGESLLLCAGTQGERSRNS